ncbi:hypothetical protein BVC93_17530 [Mycobacterium sp. MS1601]|nr:hypothetical protein BVC93_17530 [Mycobacterium sp. MS1601]
MISTVTPGMAISDSARPMPAWAKPPRYTTQFSAQLTTICRTMGSDRMYGQSTAANSTGGAETAIGVVTRNSGTGLEGVMGANATAPAPTNATPVASHDRAATSMINPLGWK